MNASNISENGTHGTTDSGVFYHGMNGFGITYCYFIFHILLFAMAIFGLALNSLAVYALKTSCKTQAVDISYIFITNLAYSDIIIDLACIYSIFYNLIHYKNYYECSIRNGLVTCLNMNSALHLLSLTVDRYYKITFPYKYVHVFRENFAKRYSACVWIFSSVLGILPVLGWRQASTNGIRYCSYFGVMSKSFLHFVLTIFVVIFALMVVCYTIIWLNATSKSKRVVVPSSLPETKISWRPTKTVLTLVLFYAVCWIPFGTVVLMHLTDMFPANYTNERKGILAAYSSSFVFLNTIFNPVIYVTRIKKFRMKIITLFLSPEGKLFEKYISSKRKITPI